MTTEVKQLLIVLSLNDMTRQWGNVPTLLNTTQKAIDAIDVGNMMNFIAVMTDNLTMMQAYQHEL